MFVCEKCRRRVRPASDSEIVFAVKMVRVDTVGPSTERAGGFFHERCFPPVASLWRRKAMPHGIGDGDG